MFKNKTTRNLLIYDFIYQTIYLLLLIPFLKEFFRFFLKYFANGYFTPNTFKTIIQSPIKILILLVVVFLISVFNIAEHASFTFAFNQIRLNNKLTVIQIFNNTYKLLKKKTKLKNIPILLFALIGIPFSNFISKSLKVPEYVTIHLKNNEYISIYVLIIITICILLSAFTTYIYNIFFLEDLDFKDSLINCIKLSRENFSQNLKCILRIIFKRIYLLIAKFAILYALLVSFYFQFDKRLSNITIIAFLTLAGIIKVSLNVAINYVTFKDISNLYFRNQRGKKISKYYYENNKIKLKLTLIGIVLVLTAFFNKYRYAVEEIQNYHAFVDLNPTITAHRGSTKNAMENTMESVEEAIELGADYAEIDVVLTKDNVIVLSHDHNLKRLTGKNINIKNLTLEELKEIKIKDFKGDKEYNFVTLKEVIEKTRGKIKLNIELKPQNDEEIFASEIVNVIDGDFENLIVSSLSIKILEEIKNIDDSIRCGFIVAFAYGDFTEKQEIIDYYVIEQDYAKVRLIKKLHRMDKDVIVWTTNSKDKIEKAIRNGADGIITDEITTAREVIDKILKNDEISVYEFIFKKFVKKLE